MPLLFGESGSGTPAGSRSLSFGYRLQISLHLSSGLTSFALRPFSSPRLRSVPSLSHPRLRSDDPFLAPRLRSVLGSPSGDRLLRRAHLGNTQMHNAECHQLRL